MPMDPLDPYVHLVMGAPPSPDYIPGAEAPPLPDYIPGPEAPPSPDYIPGPKAPPSPDYIPGSKYPEYLPPADDMLPAKEQPLPTADGETAATPPPFGYRVAARISVQPHILMPFRSKSEVERLLAIPTPPLSPVSLTSYTLPPLLMPLPIYTPQPTSSFPLPSSIPSTSGSESIPEIRLTLTIAEKRRVDDKLIGRLRRERRYFRTLATTYAKEDAHSRDYCTRIMDYCQS
nr:hypothetical protein [Tanacetum cinerariifolium]